MYTFKAETILHMSEKEIWGIPYGKINVEFCDRTVEVKGRAIIISHYYWRLFREFPGAPLESKFAILGDFISSTHLNIGETIFWHVYNNVKNKYDGIIWDMSRVFYEITNSVHNITCTKLTEYITTASLHDIIEILYDPEIVESKKEYRERVKACDYRERDTVAAIADAYNVVKKVLYTDPTHLISNGIKKLCMAKIVNQGQIFQLIGPRGYVQDIDGRVFKYPIDVGYAEGMKTLYEISIESRSAAKALFMTEEPLEESEYFNREMQLLCSSVHSIEGESCTGYSTVPFLVTKDRLFLLKGKYHMVDGKAELIWDTIDHLIGKTIQLRSMTGCGNLNTQTVCKCCVGWAANIIQPMTNLGYSISTILCAIISQIMLSTKHHEASAGSQSLELSDKHSRWIRSIDDELGYVLLQKNVTKKRPVFRIATQFVKNLNNILSVDISELSPQRVTSITEFGIAEGDAEGNIVGFMEDLKTVISGQGIYLSIEVLNYLKKNGWKSTSKYIEFQLNDWNPNDPIFYTPRLGDNIYLFLQEIKAFIMPTRDSEVSIVRFNTRGGALNAFIDLLEKRLKFNIIQAEIFVRACMTIDGNNNNYFLPHPNDNFVMMSAKDCLYNRSLTTLLAYETQAAAIADTDWYLPIPRTTHMLDPILTY